MLDLDLDEIAIRIDSFVTFFVGNALVNPDKTFLPMKTTCKKINDDEEKLYYILLTSTFQSVKVTDIFYELMKWSDILQSNDEEIHYICEIFCDEMQFTGEYFIGDHRKYFSCLSKIKKANYLADLLISYKQLMSEYGSQADFFEIYDMNANFDDLYNKLSQIKHFHTKLFRFDHLERVSRIYDLYTSPKKSYTMESGPLEGLTYMIFGERMSKDSNFSKRDIIEVAYNQWNDVVGGFYTIPSEAKWEQIIDIMEQMIIDSIKAWDIIPIEMTEYKAFAFDYESCLCNWQKGKAYEQW